MRIAMFTDTYTPQVNGVVTSIQAFKSELERSGHTVLIWAPSARRAPKESNVNRIRAFEFAPYPEYRISVPGPRIVDEFDRAGASIVHIHTPISVGAVGLGLARHFGLRAVGTFHTLLPEYMHYIVKGGGLRGLLMRPARSFAWKWCLWFYNHCDAVIAPSATTARLLKEKGVTKPIVVIPTGISVSKPVGRRAALAFRKKHELRGKLLLHVGRVTREKNIEAIIDALAETPNATLVITSDGPHRAELRKYVRRKRVQARVRFLGYLPKAELAAAYAAADLFVCASQSETQGIVLLEAAAAGLPVVALDAPVVSDFVRENRAGILAKKEDFSRKIADALGDPQLRRRVRARAQSIAKRYDIARCTRELVKLYEGLQR